MAALIVIASIIGIWMLVQVSKTVHVTLSFILTNHHHDPHIKVTMNAELGKENAAAEIGILDFHLTNLDFPGPDKDLFSFFLELHQE